MSGKRLVHSPKAYLRQMQMSSARVWIFVEGKTDLYFYSKVAEAAIGDLEGHEEFLIASAEELAPDGGGKSVLLGFFDFLKADGNLISDFAGRRTRAVFFLDKDVDDLIGRRRISPHLIYTEYYSMENYLYRHGSVVDSCAAALNIPVQRVRQALPDYERWRISSAETWIEWVGICFFVAKYGGGAANFSSYSKVNVKYFGPLASARLKEIEGQCIAGVRRACDDPRQALADCHRQVERYYAARRHDRVFNGKWYAHFLEAYLTRALTGVRVNGLARHLGSRVVQSLDFSGGWSKHLRQRLAPHLATNDPYVPPSQRGGRSMAASDSPASAACA